MPQSYDPITLNVGGTTYTTTLANLTKYQNSVLAKTFADSDKLPKDSKDSIFIDRDPVYFNSILEFLRSGSVTFSHKNDHVNKMILKEFTFWDLPLPNDPEWKFYSIYNPPNFKNAIYYQLTKPIVLYGEAQVDFGDSCLYMTYDGRDFLLNRVKGPTKVKFDARQKKLYIDEVEYNCPTPSISLKALGGTQPIVKF